MMTLQGYFTSFFKRFVEISTKFCKTVDFAIDIIYNNIEKET